MAKQGADRGTNQDFMHLNPDGDETPDATYRNAGTRPDDDEDVQDLGFIVDDHDDRRVTLTDGWDPTRPRRGQSATSGDRFATDYHVRHAAGEAQEDDFVQTSMPESDPDMQEGSQDFTADTLQDIHGQQVATDIYGQVRGPAPGLGTSLPQDMGRGGFDVRDNPLVQPTGQPRTGPLLSDAALGEREADDVG